MVISQQKNSKNNRRDLAMGEKKDKEPTFTGSRPYAPREYDKKEEERLRALLRKIFAQKTPPKG